jgi:hypothetical protein
MKCGTPGERDEGNHEYTKGAKKASGFLENSVFCLTQMDLICPSPSVSWAACVPTPHA